MAEQPSIKASGKLALRRAEARNLTDMDPVVYPNQEQGPEDELVVQVGAGDGRTISANDETWEPRDFDYRDNGYKGAIVAAEQVAEAEDVNPTLVVGAQHLEDHRKALRRLTDQG